MRNTTPPATLPPMTAGDATIDDSAAVLPLPACVAFGDAAGDEESVGEGVGERDGDAPGALYNAFDGHADAAHPLGMVMFTAGAKFSAKPGATKYWSLPQQGDGAECDQKSGSAVMFPRQHMCGPTVLAAYVKPAATPGAPVPVVTSCSTCVW